MTINQYQAKPVLTADGRPWTQRCYCCDRPIDLLKTPADMIVRIDDLRRHRKCYPGMPVDAGRKAR